MPMFGSGIMAGVKTATEAAGRAIENAQLGGASVGGEVGVSSNYEPEPQWQAPEEPSIGSYFGSLASQLGQTVAQGQERWWPQEEAAAELAERAQQIAQSRAERAGNIFGGAEEGAEQYEQIPENVRRQLNFGGPLNRFAPLVEPRYIPGYTEAAPYLKTAIENLPANLPFEVTKSLLGRAGVELPIPTPGELAASLIPEEPSILEMATTGIPLPYGRGARLLGQGAAALERGALGRNLAGAAYRAGTGGGDYLDDLARSLEMTKEELLEQGGTKARQLSEAIKVEQAAKAEPFKEAARARRGGGGIPPSGQIPTIPAGGEPTAEQFGKLGQLERWAAGLTDEEALNRAIQEGSQPQLVTSGGEASLRGQPTTPWLSEAEPGKFTTPASKTAWLEERARTSPISRLQEAGNMPPPPRGPNSTGQMSFKGKGWPAPKNGEDWVQQTVQSLPVRIGNNLRQLTAGLDLSNVLRQGWLTVRHGGEYVTNLQDMAQGLVDEEFALARNAVFRQGNYARHKGFIADIVGEPQLLGREENYAGGFVGNLPGFKQTGRANTLFLNSRRDSIFNVVENSWNRSFKAIEEDTAGPLQKLTGMLSREGDLDSLANYISRTTGRGTLGPLKDTWVDTVLGNGFFSPLYQLSRPQAAMNILNFRHPLVAIEAIKDFSTSFAATASILALAHESGLADVNLDPRSSDFGKFKIGNTRVDPWASYQQLAVLAARLISGEYESGWPTDAGQLVSQFARYKLSPLVGRTIDITGAWPGAKAGEDALGRQFGLEDLPFAFLPIFAQGIHEAAKEGLMGEALASLPASFFGLGTQTYSPTAGQSFQEQFKGATGKNWNDLLEHERFPLVEQNEQLKSAFDKWQQSREGISAQIVQDKMEKLDAISGLAATNPAAYREQAHDIVHDAKIQRDFAVKQGLIKDVELKQSPEQKAFDGYWDAIAPASESQVPDYELMDKLAADYLAGLSNSMRQKVIDELSFSRDPAYRQLLQDRQRLKSYWDFKDEAWDDIAKGTRMEKYPSLEAYRNYLITGLTGPASAGGAGMSNSAAQLAADKVLKSELEVISGASQRYLERHPELVTFLDRWGYYVPKKLQPLIGAAP